jgi:AraC-like DNA-binding protein
MYVVRPNAIEPVSRGVLAHNAAKRVVANDALGGAPGAKIRFESFTTHPLPRSQQLAAWRAWYDSIYDIDSRHEPEAGFPAENMTWGLDGFAISRVSTPAVSLNRTRALIRRNPVDHWAIILGTRSATELRYRDATRTVAARVPFIVSLAEERSCTQMQDERIVLFLARDSFRAISSILDAAGGTSLDTPGGRLLADYMLLLERNFRSLPSHDAPPLRRALTAMMSACLAPPDDRPASASPQTRPALMERVRQSVRRHLRSPSLSAALLCREAATSRSQLYRLLEGEGGVAHYIRRRRLSESFAVLCDTSNNLSIGLIAESLCFGDASDFSRAFRREFGASPSDVRAAALGGLVPGGASRASTAAGAQGFSDCLRTL